MTLALFGTFDLSVVTDRLVRLVSDFYATAPKWVVSPPTPNFDLGVNGSMPESARLDPKACSLSMYLFYVRQSSSQSNAAVTGRTLTIPFQPMALELFYLVTAWADADFHAEQRAMSVALRCFHENPIVTLTKAKDGVDGEFVLDMQVETPDELGRVWQAFATPFRLSSVFKASVVFMTPDAPTMAVPAPVQRVVVSVDEVLLFGTVSSVMFLMASGAPAPQPRTDAPGVVALDGTLVVNGSGLLAPTSDHVFVLPAGSDAEIDATAWMDLARSSSSQIILTVPDTLEPGQYLVRVGNVPPPGMVAARSAPVPFSVSALVGPVSLPPVLVADAQKMYTIKGKGFVAGSTEVLIGAAPLAPIAPGPPTVGQFSVTDPSVITFVAPKDPAIVTAGATYPVVVRVNGVQSPPAWWVTL